jgi:hypothetical protein
MYHSTLWLLLSLLMPFPQLISTACNCVVEPRNLVGGEAKFEVNLIPSPKVVVACGYAISIGLVVTARLRATQGTNKRS